MFSIRADRLGSLCACKSVDPGSRGAMHARGFCPLKSELPSLSAFACVHRMSGAAPLVGAALLSAARGKVVEDMATTSQTAFTFHRFWERIRQRYRPYRHRTCASCGRPIYRNSNYVRGNDGGVIVLLHRRCFLAEMRGCCALA